MSEFGKGLVICLVKFSEHFENEVSRHIGIADLFMKKTPEEQELMLSDDPPSHLSYGKEVHEYVHYFKHIADNIHGGDYIKALSYEIHIWANGTSDHLYEIETPAGYKWVDVEVKVKELQTLGLEIGHGFSDKIWTIEHFEKLQTLTRELAMEIDKVIGLEPELGDW